MTTSPSLGFELLQALRQPLWVLPGPWYTTLSATRWTRMPGRNSTLSLCLSVSLALSLSLSRVFRMLLQAMCQPLLALPGRWCPTLSAAQWTRMPGHILNPHPKPKLNPIPKLNPKPKLNPTPKLNPKHNLKPCVSNVVSGNIPAALGLTGAMVPYLVSDALDEDAGSRLRRGDEVRFQVSQPFQRFFFGKCTVIFYVLVCFIWWGVWCLPSNTVQLRYRSPTAKRNEY